MPMAFAMRVTSISSLTRVGKVAATPGEIFVRGNWVASSYFDPQADPAAREWLRTGDMAVVEADGAFRLVDRTRDLVKSGGEWISTIELESALSSHPAVLEAAVIAVPDDRWGERPYACVSLRPGAAATAEELIEFLSYSFPKWWLPDDVTFMASLPRTSVGKLNKRALRDRVGGDRGDIGTGGP